jgi:hypothetical protein
MLSQISSIFPHSPIPTPIVRCTRVNIQAHRRRRCTPHAMQAQRATICSASIFCMRQWEGQQIPVAPIPAPYHSHVPSPSNHGSAILMRHVPNRLDTEYRSWISLRDMDKPDLSLPSNDDNDEYSTFLRAEDLAFAETTAEAEEVVNEARRTVKMQTTDIQFTIDRLADGVHRLLQYGEAADALAGEVLVAAGEARELDTARLKAMAGTEALPLQEILRSITHTNPSLSSTLPAP